MKTIVIRTLTFSLLALVILGLAAPALAAAPAQEGDPATTVSLDLNTLWMLFSAFLVFFMQAGFALVETGFTRKKNAVHTLMMNMMVFCIGALGYFVVGFALQYGAVNYVYPDGWSFSPVTLGNWDITRLSSPLLINGQVFAGFDGFMLNGLAASSGILAFFLFQMVFMDTAATIPTGSMAERLKFSGFVLMSVFVSTLVYPIAAGWIWGGGWLANLGRSLGWGNGAVDFAGSGSVHMIGGTLGLMGAYVLGARIGKFNRDGSPNPIPGHNITLGVLGTIILFFGWFGFNPGSSLSFSGAGRNLAVLAAVNTLIAGSASGGAAMLYMWFFSPLRKPDAAMSVNGILAGLVAITAPCAFVSPGAAGVIGTIAGVWVCIATVLLEKAKIDDPVGAVPVHLGNGLFGVLAVGIFANGNPDTAGWNGVAGPVTGLLYGNASQLLAQAAEAAAVLLFVGSTSFVFFKVLDAFKLLRSDPAHELAGLDIPEIGSVGYPEDWVPARDAVAYGRREAKSVGAPAAAD